MAFPPTHPFILQLEKITPSYEPKHHSCPFSSFVQLREIARLAKDILVDSSVWCRETSEVRAVALLNANSTRLCNESFTALDGSSKTLDRKKVVDTGCFCFYKVTFICLFTKTLCVKYQFWFSSYQLLFINAATHNTSDLIQSIWYSSSQHQCVTCNTTAGIAIDL